MSAPGMEPDALYNQFVEAFVSRGVTDVDESWPREVRERCRFFLEFARTGGASRSTESVVKTLAERGVRSGLSAPDAAGDALDTLSSAGERYVFESELGRGGMGRIVAAYDRDLRRHVAIKVLLGPEPDIGMRSRFLEEAQATAQLEHPNITPVYDLGVSEGGEPFFSMKWIRGRSFAQILAAGGGEFSQIRLLQILQQVAMGVDFAHSRGVIHRDLKPENVMVGDYGEVLVVDWGVAKVLGRRDDSGRDDSGRDDRRADERAAVTTERSEQGIHTLEGAIQGSLAFMAPEQARGDVAAIDRRTDVFGLGAILYMILTGRPIYEGSTFAEVLDAARKGRVVLPRERAPEREIPPALEAVCMEALAAAPGDRFESARAFHDRLQAYVEMLHDHERRAAEAARLLGEGDRLRDALAGAEAREGAIVRERERLASEVRSHDAPERKKRLWDATGRWKDARNEARRLFNDGTAAYQSVLRVDPENERAREALARLYFTRLVAAEGRGDVEAAELYAGLVAQHDPNAAALLARAQEVAFRSVPSGAEVSVARFVEEDLTLVESAFERLGRTPFTRPFPRGSYVAVFRMAERREVRLPFFVERDTPLALDVTLREDAEIPPGFVQVAGGTSIVGGEPLIAGLARARREFPELFVSRDPVTLGEYCEFLNERLADASLRQDELYLYLPVFDRQEIAVRGADGAFRPRRELSEHVPVMAVSVIAMRAYCAWLGERLAKDVRLLTEAEWERCARGADGRLFPWGNEFDWSLCKGGPSRQGHPLPEPVGSFAADSSPFGVRDMAGGVRELCVDELRPDTFPCKGGSWYHGLPLLFRCDASTRINHETSKSVDVGFRVCYSIA